MVKPEVVPKPKDYPPEISGIEHEKTNEVLK